ncbi:MAG: nucleotidyltransferase domain-containing protein [bacterium]|nr:nucleotidyltransferase domain-containing protein [bacterium]
MADTGLHRHRDLAPYREYHARRSRERLERREARRQRILEAARAGIRRLAPAFAPIRAVYLYGSLLRPEQFSQRSDVDVAIECDDPAIEGRFRRALEEELCQNIDLRPLEGRLARAVELYGECVYEREVPDPGA